MIESKKPVKEEEMETMLSSITSQALEYYNNESKGNEEQKDKVRRDLVELMKNEVSTAMQHNLERLQMGEEKMLTDAVTVASFGHDNG